MQRLFHSSSPLSLLRTLVTSFAISGARSALSIRMTDGFSFAFAFFPVYSVKAAVSASASRALKKTIYLGISPV